LGPTTPDPAGGKDGFRLGPQTDVSKRSICCAMISSAGRDQLGANPPSGDPTPSCADIQMTQQIIAMASPRTQCVCDRYRPAFD
jgi:hypothetical protein